MKRNAGKENLGAEDFLETKFSIELPLHNVASSNSKFYQLF